MKGKIVAGTTLTLFLTVTLFIAFPVKSQFVGTIKIGAVGPMPWIQGKGIAEAVKLAAKQINTEHGIEGAPGEFWKVEVVTADTLRGQPDPTTATGTAAGMELVAAGCDYVIGGFRTEAVYGVREVLMDSAASNGKPIFIIAGAATNELIDCNDDPTCGACVRCNYNRYRYTFRVTPMNSTMLFQGIAGYLKYVMAAKLMPIYTGYAKPLKIAVISEGLTWTDVMHYYLHDIGGYFWNTVMNMTTYGGVSVVYGARVSPIATDISAELLAAEAAGAKLIIEVLSGPVGRTMAIQWYDLAIPAVLGGIDVPGQEIPLHWTATGGGCEYESFVSTSGTKIPMTPQITKFWDDMFEEYGHAPIYTSYGAYDAVMAIKETIEAVGRWPVGDRELVPLTEKTYRAKGGAPLYGTAMMGTFKYTGPHPMATTEYDDYTFTNASGTFNYLQANPTMMGTLHELFHTPAELGPTWNPPFYARGQDAQWQWDPINNEGRLQIFYPMNMPYSKKFMIPPWMYSHADTDIAKEIGPYLKAMPDGLVDDKDMDIATFAWLSKPGDGAWVAGGEFYGLVTDQDGNNFINIADVSSLAKDYGYSAIAEYGQWPLP